MMELLQRVFGAKSDRPIDYETSKRLAASGKPAERREVAGNHTVRPELLYYLANDGDASVRAAVAANEATPVQADLLLARDGDDGVRVDLARKIAQLAPVLSREAHERLRKLTREVLDILVRDQVPRVRQVIAETLKDVADAPADIIAILARDCEIAVAEPVLRYSPLLSDEDLLDIIARSPVPGALAAIAQRSAVESRVADAIGSGGDEAAVAALLANPSAQIREETLDRLVERAPAVSAWHRPLVERPRLSADIARKLAGFVADHLLAVLRDRRDLDPATAAEVAATVKRRLATEPGAVPAAVASPHDPDEAIARARGMKEKGTLDEAAVLGALAGERAFARAALAVLADWPLAMVDRVLAAHSPKGVTALAWKCGLSMRGALKLQMQLAQISPATALKPRADGGYPLSAEAMQWQLDFFTGMGVKAS